MSDLSSPEMRDGTLSLRKSETDSLCTLCLAGELDLANCDTLEAELESAGREGMEIVLDMTELDFIDSTGIALLIATHNRLNSGEVRFRLVPSRSDAVVRVLKLTGVDESLPTVAGTELPSAAA